MALFQVVPGGADHSGLLFDGAADLDRAVVTEEAADFAGYLRDGVGGKLRAVGFVEALDGFQEAHAA